MCFVLEKKRRDMFICIVKSKSCVGSFYLGKQLNVTWPIMTFSQSQNVNLDMVKLYTS